MNYVTILGFVAGSLTTMSFVPQVIKVWKSKSTGDISLGMLTILCLGFLLWLIYGALVNSPPIILANAVALVLGVIIVLFKIKYK